MDELAADVDHGLPSTLRGVAGVDTTKACEIAVLEAMIAGQRNPRTLAELALGRMRPRNDTLTEALTGHFEDHHGFLARMMLDRIDELTARIDELTRRIEAMISPRY